LKEVRILICPESCGTENSAARIDSGYREKLNDVRKNSAFGQKNSQKQQNIVGKPTVVVNKYLIRFACLDDFYQHFCFIADKISLDLTFPGFWRCVYARNPSLNLIKPCIKRRVRLYPHDTQPAPPVPACGIA
jgi:hypothetical protein